MGKQRKNQSQSDPMSKQGKKQLEADQMSKQRKKQLDPDPISKQGKKQLEPEPILDLEKVISDIAWKNFLDEEIVPSCCGCSTRCAKKNFKMKVINEGLCGRFTNKKIVQ